MINQTVIAGKICSTPREWHSPAGVLHHQFFLEHRSQQQVAGLTREVYCRLPVVMACMNTIPEKQVFTRYMQVTVTGFLVRRRDRHGEAELVLQATHIEIVN